MQVDVFWVVTSCNVAARYQHLGGPCSKNNEIGMTCIMHGWVREFTYFSQKTWREGSLGRFKHICVVSPCWGYSFM